MKILEYIIRFKNEAKAGADAAAKVAQDLGKKTADVLRGSSMAVGGEIKDFFARLRGEVGTMMGSVPGLGKMKDAISGSAAAIAGGAVALGEGIRNIIEGVSAEYRRLADEIEEISIKAAAKQEQIINKQRVATTAQSQIGLQNDLIGEIAQLKQQLARSRSGQDAMGAVDFATSYWSGTGAAQRSNDAAMEQNIFLLERQLALAKKKEAKLTEEEAKTQTKVATGSFESAVNASADKRAFAAMDDAGKKAVLQGRLDEAKFGLAEIGSKIKIGGEKWTDELAKKVDRLLAEFDNATSGLAEISERSKEKQEKASKEKLEADKKTAEGIKELRAKVMDERISMLTPEQQLAGRRDQYRRVVQAGLNTADPEKRLELFNRAFELRAIMRPLIESLASKAAGGDEESGGSMGGGVGRVRRGPLGLGRLSGNRAGYRFGRVLSSQFDGASVSGNASAPGKRPMEDIGEEQLRVLKSIEAKTGFGKGG